MRKSFVALASLATLVATPIAAPVAFADDDDGEAYDHEKLVYGQRRLVMAPGLLRPDVAFIVSQTGADSDTAIGFGVLVDWTPIDKLQVGAVATPRISPDADVNDPQLNVRYLLLDGGFQLAVLGAYTFSDPGAIHLGVPLRFRLNDAARLDLSPILDLNLPPEDGDLVVDLNVLLSAGISLTRALYLDVSTGIVIPDFDFDLAAIPLGLEVGYSIPGGDSDTAFIDIFLRARFDAFLLPNAPEGSDALNLDVWSIALGGRFHVGLD